MSHSTLTRLAPDHTPAQPLSQPVEEFRSAMANLSAGVSVVTALGDTGPHGTTVTALMSLSVRPPLAAVALDTNSSLLSMLDIGHRIGVNILASNQASVASRFACKTGDRFHATNWHNDSGRPRLQGIHAWIASTVDRFIAAGDHVLVVTTVDSASSSTNQPLTYWQRRFGTHSSA